MAMAPYRCHVPVHMSHHSETFSPKLRQSLARKTITWKMGGADEHPHKKRIVPSSMFYDTRIVHTHSHKMIRYMAVGGRGTNFELAAAALTIATYKQQ